MAEKFYTLLAQLDLFSVELHIVFFHSDLQRLKVFVMVDHRLVDVVTTPKDENIICQSSDARETMNNLVKLFFKKFRVLVIYRTAFGAIGSVRKASRTSLVENFLRLS